MLPRHVGSKRRKRTKAKVLLYFIFLFCFSRLTWGFLVDAFSSTVVCVSFIRPVAAKAKRELDAIAHAEGGTREDFLHKLRKVSPCLGRPTQGRVDGIFGRRRFAVHR